jgi:hypothetical protein
MVRESLRMIVPRESSSVVFCSIYECQGHVIARGMSELPDEMDLFMEGRPTIKANAANLKLPYVNE